MKHPRVLCLALCLLLLFVSVGVAAERKVVVYTSVDQPTAAPILKKFEQQTGIEVVLVTDAEATKTVGLAERLRAEKNNPQADVWWGNEVFYTINLANDGVLAPYESPAAAGIPALHKDPQHLWAGNALRARVLCVFEQSTFVPKGIEDLANPALRSKVAMARPTAGTTGGHVAALYVLWGPEKAKSYFRSLHNNDVKLLGGNATVALQTGLGKVFAGLTDNDDVHAAAEQGGSLSQVLPDQETFGTLTIPTTVALIQGARNPDAAKELIDHLLSAEVEKALIDAKFAGWSVRGGENAVRSMNVDYREVARIMPHAIREATALLEGR